MRRLFVLAALLFALPFIAGSSVATATTIVTLVGDSITEENDAGWYTSYPSKLQALLGGDYFVNEQGKSGATLREDGIVQVPYIDTDEYDDALASTPDIVVIMLGTNDGRTANWINDPGSTFATDVFVDDYDSLIADFSVLTSFPIFVVTPPPAYSNASSSYDRDVINDVIVQLVLDPIGARTDVTLIDLHAVFLAEPGCGNLASTCSLLPDGIHPSDDPGSQLIADTIYTEIITAVMIPEPSTALLLATGLAGLAAAGRRRALH